MEGLYDVQIVNSKDPQPYKQVWEAELWYNGLFKLELMQN